MKDSGLLAFTFHQSKPSGWLAVMRALSKAGFVVTAIQPVKAEMSVSITKAGAAAPNNLDSIVVCRKMAAKREAGTPQKLADGAEAGLAELQAAGVRVGLTDIQSVVRGSILALLTHRDSPLSEEVLLAEAERQAARVAHNLNGDANPDGPVAQPA
jgi:adenine-specific DNA methylase